MQRYEVILIYAIPFSGQTAGFENVRKVFEKLFVFEYLIASKLMICVVKNGALPSFLSI